MLGLDGAKFHLQTTKPWITRIKAKLGEARYVTEDICRRAPGPRPGNQRSNAFALLQQTNLLAYHRLQPYRQPAAQDSTAPNMMDWAPMVVWPSVMELAHRTGEAVSSL